MRSKKLLIIYLPLLAILAIPGIWLCLVSYDEFCRLLLTKSNKLYRLSEFETQYLTSVRFNLLRIAALTLPFLFSAAFFFSVKNTFVRTLLAQEISGFADILRGMRKLLSDLSVKEKAVLGCLFTIFAIRTIYLAHASPITSDEAWTYLTFASRGLPVSMSLNYSPNNHIFYSVLANLTYYLPFDSTFNLRLPTVLFTLACCLLFFICIRRWFGAVTACLSTALLVSLYPFMYYSVQARGYMLSTFLFAVCYFGLLAIVTNGRRAFWIIFTVGSILGAYTIPSFLYPFLSLSLFGFVYFLANKRSDDIKRLLLSIAVVGLCVLVLYLPVFVMSGVEAVVSNQYVRPIDRALVLRSLPEYCFKLFQWFLGDFYFGLVFLIAPFVQTDKTRPIANLSYTCLVLVPVFCISHSLLPFERVWTYLAVSIAAAAALPIDNFIGRFRPNISMAALICVIVIGLGEHDHQKRIAVDDYEMRALKTSKYMQFLQDQGLQKFFVEEDMTSIYVDYFLTTHQRQYEIHYGFAEPFDKNAEYDCIILKTGNPLGEKLEGYRLIYGDDLSKILIRN